MSTATKHESTESIVKDLSSHGEHIANDELQHFPEAAVPGERVRQGDIYITKLDGVPKHSKPRKVVLQLADGNTQGSRHCLDSVKGVEMFAVEGPGPYDGPVILTTEPRTLTHPEHGDFHLPPGCYAVTFQRTQDAEDRERRVQD